MMILKILQFFLYFHLMENIKTPTLKVPTDQEVEEAEKILADDVNPDWDAKNGYFIIDVSGKYHVYYTLWRYKPSMANQYISSMVFITNLSTDFLTAVNKSKKICGRTPIIIDKIGSHQGLFKAQKSQILTFGKINYPWPRFLDGFIVSDTQWFF